MMLMECDECGLRAEVYVDGSCIECAEKRLAKQAEQIKVKHKAIAAIWTIISDDFPRGTGDNHGTCASPAYLAAARMIESEFKRIER